MFLTPLPLFISFFLMIRPPPTSTLFPYTTLFRSDHARDQEPGTDQACCSDLVNRDAEQAEMIEGRSEEHTSELQSHSDLVCRLLLEKKKKNNITSQRPYRRTVQTKGTNITKDISE